MSRSDPSPSGVGRIRIVTWPSRWSTSRGVTTRPNFFLTQVVSHHSMGEVEAFLSELDKKRVDAPPVFGVFYYRSANPKTLARVSRFLPVPAEELTREFERGASAEEICARSILELRRAGARNIYLSNLGFRHVDRRHRAIMEALSEMEG